MERIQTNKLTQTVLTFEISPSAINRLSKYRRTSIVIL